MLGDGAGSASSGTSAAAPGRPAWLIPTAVAVMAVVAVAMWGPAAGSPQTPVEHAPVATGAEPVSDPDQDGADGDATQPDTPPLTPATIDAQRSAHSAYAAGDFGTALAALEEAVASNPADPAARNNLAQVMIRMGRTEDALQHLDEAVRADDTRWEYRFNRARALGLLNRWSDAVRDYRAATQIFPEDHATLYNLGLALLRVGDYSAAATSFEQAFTLAPEEHDFLISLATAHLGAKQPAKARVAFQRFLELAPNHAEVPRVQAVLRGLTEADQ